MNKKTCKDCLHCSIEGADEAYCCGMPWHYPFGGSDTVALDKEACGYFWERDKPTVFNRITTSPEVLAPQLVYVIKQLFTISGTSRENPGGYEVKTKWFSTIIDGDFDSGSEAIAATLARLKEVEK